MSVTAPSTLSSDAFDAFVAGRQEPEWLVERRRRAWQTFSELPWPDRRSEEWMRTDIRMFKPERYGFPAGDANPEDVDRFPAGLLREKVDVAGTSVSIDSRSVRSELDAELRDKGVIFCGIDRAVVEHPELLEKYLMTRVFPVDYDRFAAWHAAAFSGGSFLYVPRGVELDRPLHSLALLGDGRADMSHLLVVLEEGAKATLLTETTSDSETSGGMHCGGIELIQEAGSRLRFVNLQDWGKGVWHFAHQRALLGRDASLQWTIAAMGSRLAKVNQHVVLDGPGAHSQVNGVLFTEERQHLSYHTQQHHKAPSCRSDFLYKAALQDRSRTVWRGMIKVDERAQKTDGYQRNDNLLLSDHVRADAIPGLEIEADDVRCTHGSTTGRVDDELIFYAQCRGFTRGEAARMIVTGFFQQIFDRITIGSVRNALGRAIARRVREYE